MHSSVGPEQCRVHEDERLDTGSETRGKVTRRNDPERVRNENKLYFGWNDCLYKAYQRIQQPAPGKSRYLDAAPRSRKIKCDDSEVSFNSSCNGKPMFEALA